MRGGGKIMLALMWLAGAAAPGLAQGRVSTAPQSSPIIQLPGQGQSQAQSRDPLVDAVTFVSFIDNALPKTQVRTIFDSGMRVRRPGRAEYFQPTGGLPNSPGPPLPETSIDYQDLRTYGEVAVLPRFSTFMYTGFRWVNPDVNRNDGGFGDIDLGFKWAVLSMSDLLLTFQMRAYIPSASSPALGTEHFSFEPALLVNYQVLSFLTLEGEGRFWVPVGAGDFAGEVVRYGLGVSYRQPTDRQFWIAPVAEGIGWTVLSGRAMAANQSGGYYLEDASGTTIFNMYGGLRVGWGDRASLYAGYGRALTGPSWYKDLWRLELRFFF